MTFGAFIKECRIARELTLSEVSRASGISIMDWSKMERDINTAPKNPDRWTAVVQTLDLDESIGSTARCLADESMMTMTPVVTEADLDEHLPIFHRLSPKQVAKLRPLIRESLTRNPNF